MRFFQSCRTESTANVGGPHQTTLEAADMSRYELELRLDAPGVEEFGGALSEESERARARVYRKLGLKVHSNAWVRINLSSTNGMNKVQKLIEECKAGNVTAGTANVYEHLDKDQSAAADWSYLYTKTANTSFSLWDDYPSYISSELADREHELLAVGRLSVLHIVRTRRWSCIKRYVRVGAICRHLRAIGSTRHFVSSLPQ